MPQLAQTDVTSAYDAQPTQENRIAAFSRPMESFASGPSLSQVGVNGIMGAQAVEGIASLPGAIRDGWSLVSALRTSSKMAGVRATGAAGEVLAGIVKNTEPIESATGAAYRVPDELDHAAKIIGEVKNFRPGQKVYLTGQIKDELAFAGKNGYRMVLRVRPWTHFSAPLQKLIDSGAITVVRF